MRLYNYTIEISNLYLKLAIYIKKLAIYIKRLVFVTFCPKKTPYLGLYLTFISRFYPYIHLHILGTGNEKRLSSAPLDLWD